MSEEKLSVVTLRPDSGEDFSRVDRHKLAGEFCISGRGGHLRSPLAGATLESIRAILTISHMTIGLSPNQAQVLPVFRKLSQSSFRSLTQFAGEVL